MKRNAGHCRAGLRRRVGADALRRSTRRALLLATTAFAFVPRFAFATKDRFFLIVFSSDPKYNPVEVRRFLEGLGPRSISEVPD